MVGKLLNQFGYVEESYIDAMVETYKEFGSYIVITKNVAMPHARPEKGAIKSGFSIIRLSKPLNFGNKENDPVSLVIGLSSISNDEHIENIKKICSLLEDENSFQILMRGKATEINNLL